MRYYLWLLPDAPHDALLSAQISDLSVIYRTPLFRPHITIASGKTPYQFHDFRAPELSLLPAKSEEHMFRALYYPIAPTPHLLNIRKQYVSDEVPYEPHLSLIYGHFSKSRRRAWLQSCPKYTETIRFGRLSLIQGGRDVEKWRHITTWHLKGTFKEI